MPKKFIFILIIVLLVAGLAFWFSLLLQPKENTPGTESSGTNFISDFFNSINQKSKEGANNSDTIDDIYSDENPMNQNGIEGLEAPKLKLFRISTMSIAGFGILEKERFVDEPTPNKTESVEPKKPTAPRIESVPLVRYVSKNGGHIYQTFLDTIKERKFLTGIIPAVEEAFFANNGESIIMRYLKPDGKTIATFTAPLPKEILGGDTSSSELIGSFLPENIKNMSVVSDGSKIFYLYEVLSGFAGITASPGGASKTQIFDSPFTEWLSQWPNTNLITVTTKPSHAVAGFMYHINPGKKDLQKVLGGINGLLTLTSPDGGSVLYSNSFLKTSIYNTETKTYRELKTQTLADKCVWLEDSSAVYCATPKLIDSKYKYPDAWYMGETSFNDTFVRVDIENEKEVVVFDPEELGIDIDAYGLVLTKDGKNLLFVNKKDSSLWGLEINN